jgi:hypothetical protein
MCQSIGNAYGICHQLVSPPVPPSIGRLWLWAEQALGALEHLPEQRNTREQAVNLQLTLRLVLRPLGNFGRILAGLREAEALVQTLADPRRLGQVSLFFCQSISSSGVHMTRPWSPTSALALATAGGDAVLHALASQRLGWAYQIPSRPHICATERSPCNCTSARVFNNLHCFRLPDQRNGCTACRT